MKLAPFQPTKHDAKRFSCGVLTIDVWIRRYAKRSQRDSLSRVFVLTNCEPSEQSESKRPILGYFALSMCSVELVALPEQDRARLPRYPVPAVLLTRLAVAKSHQSQGLGGVLLYKAAQKALLASEAVAARLLIVDALDANAVAFYLRFGFCPSPQDPLRPMMGLERLRDQTP